MDNVYLENLKEYFNPKWKLFMPSSCKTFFFFERQKQTFLKNCYALLFFQVCAPFKIQFKIQINSLIWVEFEFKLEVECKLV